MYFPPRYTSEEARAMAAERDLEVWMNGKGELMGYWRKHRTPNSELRTSNEGKVDATQRVPTDASEANSQSGLSAKMVSAPEPSPGFAPAEPPSPGPTPIALIRPSDTFSRPTGEGGLQENGDAVESIPTTPATGDPPPIHDSPFTNHGSVLMFHGNGALAAWTGHYADVIQEIAPLDFYALEFPGYAGRSGQISEQSIQAAAEEAFQLLPTNAPVYLVGESLGTGVAAYLAGKHPDRVAGVIVLGAYNRIIDVAKYHYPLLPVRLFLRDRYPAEDYLQTYHGPLAVGVGGRDRVVPMKFGRRLHDHYAGPKRIWEFPDGNHETIMDQPAAFWREVIAFWEKPDSKF